MNMVVLSATLLKRPSLVETTVYEFQFGLHHVAVALSVLRNDHPLFSYLFQLKKVAREP